MAASPRARRRRAPWPRAAAAPQPVVQAPAPVARRRRQQPSALARYATFEDVVALIRARRDVSLLVEIESGVRLVRYAPGRIEFEPAEAAPPDLAARLAQRLQLWTGARWGVAVVGSGGGDDHRRGARDASRATCTPGPLEHPMVQAVLAAFPGAEIREVRPADAPDDGADGAAAGRGRSDGRLGSVRSLRGGELNAQGFGTAWRHGQDHEAGAGDADAA